MVEEAFLQLTDIPIEERETLSQLPHTPPISVSDAAKTVSIHASLPHPSTLSIAQSSVQGKTGESVKAALSTPSKAKEDADFEVSLRGFSS